MLLHNTTQLRKCFCPSSGKVWSGRPTSTVLCCARTRHIVFVSHSSAPNKTSEEQKRSQRSHLSSRRSLTASALFLCRTFLHVAYRQNGRYLDLLSMTRLQYHIADIAARFWLWDDTGGYHSIGYATQQNGSSILQRVQYAALC
jgi:hypothetical protein